MADTCATCKFALQAGQSLECHKSAPAASTGPIGDTIGYKVIWPQVGGGDWCGDFTAKV